jgi:hypothetical protein
MPDNISDMKINDVISFKSKSSVDDNTYKGKVLGKINYDVAISVSDKDIEAYHNNILNDYPSLPEKEDLEYFILRDIDRQETILFANEWILESTFDIIETSNKIDITILNKSSEDVDDILSLLFSNDIHAIVTKVY